MTAIKVRRGEPGDAEEISQVLASAFVDYPWTRWTVDADNHVSRVESLQRLAFVELVLPFGEAWVATDEGAVVSAALWMRPDVTVPASVWDRIAPTQSLLEGGRHVASVAAEAACTPHRPTDPHYFLGSVGTLPSHRRLGYATAALRPVLARDDFAYLETCGADNVQFYAVLGFSVVAEVTIPGGGPTVWAMSR